MTAFNDDVRRAMAERGLSLRALAAATNYDPGYLSRVLNGKRRPSDQLAQALHRELGVEYDPVAVAGVSGAAEVDPGGVAEATHLRSTVAHLVSFDGRFGGDEIAPVAVRVWKSAQRNLDRGLVPQKETRDVLAATAEAAELAGWLLFDADDQNGCRAATLEALLMARQAGDRSMERFAMTNLAMQDIETHRPGEAIRIADALLSQRSVPARVALLARIRRGRALAQLGQEQPALSDLTRAEAMVEDSVTRSDPAWTWWVNECEVAGHYGEALLDLGMPEAALAHLERASELADNTRPDGRGSLYYRVSLVSGYKHVQAWTECESALRGIPSLMDTVSSRRNRRRLQHLARSLIRTPHIPNSLKELAHTVITPTQGPTGRDSHFRPT